MAESLSVPLASSLKPFDQKPPRRLLRRLIMMLDILPGASVLVASPDPGELVERLQYLGVDAAGLCRSEEECTRLRSQHSDCDFTCTPQHESYSAVVATDPNILSGQPTDAECIASAARLLQILRPGGRLGLAFSGDADAIETAMPRVLATFDSITGLAEETPSLQTSLLQRSLLLRRESVGFVVVRTPDDHEFSDRWNMLLADAASELSRRDAA